MKTTNDLFSSITKEALILDQDVQKGCTLALDVKTDYEIWQKNAMNKEAALKLKNSFDKWKKKNAR